MAKPPGPAGKPAPASIFDREWSNGSEVVGSGEDVK
jgi:hypothetical protein